MSQVLTQASSDAAPQWGFKVAAKSAAFDAVGIKQKLLALDKPDRKSVV